MGEVEGAIKLVTEDTTKYNISICRPSIANRTLHIDFEKVENLLTKLDLKYKPARIWNCDETGLSYVIKSGKIVCQVERKYVYKQSCVDRGATTTLLYRGCASGMSIPPMVIFNCARMKERLAETSMPSLVRLSPSAQATHPTPSVSVVKREKMTQNNDNFCGSCGGLYSNDAKNQNGAE